MNLKTKWGPCLLHFPAFIQSLALSVPFIWNERVSHKQVRNNYAMMGAGLGVTFLDALLYCFIGLSTRGFVD